MAGPAPALDAEAADPVPRAGRARSRGAGGPQHKYWPGRGRIVHDAGPGTGGLKREGDPFSGHEGPASDRAGEGRPGPGLSRGQGPARSGGRGAEGGIAIVARGRSRHGQLQAVSAGLAPLPRLHRGLALGARGPHQWRQSRGLAPGAGGGRDEAARDGSPAANCDAEGGAGSAAGPAAGRRRAR